MSPEVIGVIGLVFSLMLLFTGMSVGLSLVLVSFIGISVLSSVGAAGNAIATATADVTGKYLFTVVPLFVLMGEVAFKTQISGRVYNCADKWVGNLRGGLGIATILGCAGFASICGTSVATAATLSKVAYPQMNKRGYLPELSTGSISAGGTLGILIPPSMAFVNYGVITETSIGKLFIAGIFPGILLISLFVSVIVIWSFINPDLCPHSKVNISMKEKIVALKDIIEIALIFIFVIGGLYIGLFTPTEAGAVGAAGVILSTIIRRTLTLKLFLEALSDTLISTGLIVLLLVGAFCMSRFIALSGAPLALANYIASVSLPPIAVLFMILLSYIFLGCVIETMVMVVVTLPVYFPLVVALGFDPIWFGVLVVIIIEVALITPPIGLNIWIINGLLPDVPMGKIYKGSGVLMTAALITLILIVLFPQIALFLPNLMN